MTMTLRLAAAALLLWSAAGDAAAQDRTHDGKTLDSYPLPDRETTAYQRPMELQVVLKGAMETLLLPFDFSDRAGCEEARAVRVLRAQAGLDTPSRPAGWTRENVANGIREVSPDGEEVTTTFRCVERERR